jgi:hypothetical protein
MLRTDLVTLGALLGNQINQERDTIRLRFKRSMLSDYSEINCSIQAVRLGRIVRWKGKRKGWY